MMTTHNSGGNHLIRHYTTNPPGGQWFKFKQEQGENESIVPKSGYF